MAEDPRPKYHHDPMRVYGFPFAGLEIRFSVSEGKVSVLDVCRIKEASEYREEENQNKNT